MALLLHLALLYATSLVFAQFPPTPEGITTLKSRFHEGVEISYKEPVRMRVDSLRSLGPIPHAFVLYY